MWHERKREGITWSCFLGEPVQRDNGSVNPPFFLLGIGYQQGENAEIVWFGAEDLR